MYFEYPDKANANDGQVYNVNRLHLEKFTFNCIDYLSGTNKYTLAHYWNYTDQGVIPFPSEEINFTPMMRPTIKPYSWEIAEHPMKLSRNVATGNFWDVAGQRILIMGKENGGIEEIWAHPFMALRDYEVGIKFSNEDTILWLNHQMPMIEITPEAFIRQYKFEQAFLKEVIVVSPDQPKAVIHYEYSGDNPAEVFLRFKSNQRIMWPYSEKVLGGMKYDFNEKLNAFIITDPSGDFVSMVGFNKPTEVVHFSSSAMLPAFRPVKNPIGHYTNITATDSLWRATPANDELILTALSAINLEMNDNFDVVIAATNQGVIPTISSYQEAQAYPYKVYQESSAYKRDLMANSLQITSPDSVFNLGFQWALEGSDRFYVNTPGLGKSLVAGYATTASGWYGDHEVNGRPGYGWYFGRDAEWSGMALLQYGDFEKVKGILTLLQDFQDLNGKILHELSTSGFVHFDASDATPLYVVLAGRYLKHSGDTAFIRSSLPNIKAAMDFMYSTDTDGDGLIENTNVGHGWVEGGGLFGSHTSLYLASCWAEALEMAAYMSSSIGYDSLAKAYSLDEELVLEKINEIYWDENEQFLYHGIKQDGSFIKEKSIMPTIPLLFGQVSKDESTNMLETFATNEYTSNWGVRIVSERSPLFKPIGYHTGSVWPLYTGWTALAEYHNGRPVQGFSHIMNNLNVYQDWSLGFVEEVMNGAEYKPSGVCHHQDWSETMVLQPIIEGMLGLKPDAMKNTLGFAPNFPADWDTVIISNIKVGKHILDFKQERSEEKILFTFSQKSGNPLTVLFCPQFPRGCEITNKFLDGKMLRPADYKDTIELVVHQKAVLEYNYHNGIEILPHIAQPKPGSSPEGLRIISETRDGKVYTIEFQSMSGAREEFEVYINDHNAVKTEKAELLSRDGNIYRFQVDFPEVDGKYAFQTVRIFLD
jgi:glycogen debranching enzyme